MIKKTKVFLLTDRYLFTFKDKVYNLYNGQCKFVDCAKKSDVIFIASWQRDAAYGLYSRFSKKPINLINLDYICGFIPQEK